MRSIVKAWGNIQHFLVAISIFIIELIVSELWPLAMRD